MQLVVVMAVKNAVSAATITFASYYHLRQHLNQTFLLHNSYFLVLTS